MSLKTLQSKVGVTPDGVLGKNTLKSIAKYYNLTPEETAHFIGQCSHETGGFRVFEENLNYSGAGLVTTFKKYFPNLASTLSYDRNPKRIANKVYANRMGNGNEESGDGWKYRGRGAIQLTGKSNYTKFSESLKEPFIILSPDQVATTFAFDSAKFFFDENNLWKSCKVVTDASILSVTKRVNGGTHGLQERKDLTHKFYAMLTHI